jgi:NADH-quinone oxidoreductase subunit H
MEIVQSQSTYWLFLYPNLFLAFLIFMISSFAETNRLPFDLPESEQELVGGYHTEYGSMKFAFFFLAEYANMITASALMVTLFFGGWQVPFALPEWLNRDVTWLAPFIFQPVGLVYILSFFLKMLFFLGVFIWIRWTLPRFRYDQLMNLGWKVFLPISLANVFVTGIWMAWRIG